MKYSILGFKIENGKKLAELVPFTEDLFPVAVKHLNGEDVGVVSRPVPKGLKIGDSLEFKQVIGV